ncbi:hypothetical protein LTS15_010059 [Exophiala xenobiotica]|nr:hypothetical protein LTS15_010059 [Exophiala xenobiotica]
MDCTSHGAEYSRYYSWLNSRIVFKNLHGQITSRPGFPLACAFSSTPKQALTLMTRVSISSGVKRLGKRKPVGSNCATWGSFMGLLGSANQFTTILACTSTTKFIRSFSLLLKARLGKLNLYEKIAAETAFVKFHGYRFERYNWTDLQTRSWLPIITRRLEVEFESILSAARMALDSDWEYVENIQALQDLWTIHWLGLGQ